MIDQKPISVIGIIKSTMGTTGVGPANCTAFYADFSTKIPRGETKNIFARLFFKVFFPICDFPEYKVPG